MMSVLLLALATLCPPPVGDLPVYGRPVPGLSDLDVVMQAVMAQHGVHCGTLAVMKDGVVVYQRGFGCPEITPMRLASVEKPMTAAAIRVLVAQGLISLDDNVFDLDQFGGGILDIEPWGDLGTEFLRFVTVQQVLDHRGGWDSALDIDPQFETLEIGNQMDLGGPADRIGLVRYMLGRPLQWVPGTTYAYSNFGYMVLGLIVEQVSGQSLQSFVRANVLTPNQWVPATELFRGQTFIGSQDPREPLYDDPSLCVNIFDPDGDMVLCPYGSWSHTEAFQGHGNLVGSAAPLLEFADRYNVFGTSMGGSMIGAQHGGDWPSWTHTGSIPGTSTVVRQRDDGIHVAVLFNKRSGDVDLALTASDLIYFVIDGGDIAWPDFSVDGFYVDFDASFQGSGGYSDPFPSMSSGLAETTDGSKLRFKPGSTSWTGVITERTLLDAPLGTAVIGD